MTRSGITGSALYPTSIAARADDSADASPKVKTYTVVGELKGPKGAAEIETIWIEEPGTSFVRLVTVVPRSS
jgi:hypothetical protein